MKDDPANASFVREGDYALLALFLVEVLTFSACRFKLEVIGSSEAILTVTRLLGKTVRFRNSA